MAQLSGPDVPAARWLHRCVARLEMAFFPRIQAYQPPLFASLPFSRCAGPPGSPSIAIIQAPQPTCPTPPPPTCPTPPPACATPPPSQAFIFGGQLNDGALSAEVFVLTVAPAPGSVKMQGVTRRNIAVASALVSAR